MKRLCKGLYSTESEAEAHANADKHQRRAPNTSATEAPIVTAATDGAQSVVNGDAAHAGTVTFAVPRPTVQTHQPEMEGILPNGTSPNQALVLKFSSAVLNVIGRHSVVLHCPTPEQRAQQGPAATRLTRQWS